MKKPRCFMAALLIFGLLPTCLCAQAAPNYVVEFRDGTLLEMAVPDHEIGWQRVASDGKISVEPIQFSAVSQLEMVQSPVTERVRRIRRWIDQLGDESYKLREEANNQLIQVGGDFMDLIRSAEGASDPEIKWRLQFVLKELEGQPRPNVQQEYDQLRLVDAQGSEATAVVQGDAGEWEITAEYRGRELVLNRTNVRVIRRGALPAPEFSAEMRPGQRLSSDEVDQFPEDGVRIDFDFLSDRQETDLEMELDELFLDQGIRLRTSLDDGYIGAFDFKVAGAQSGLRSAGGRVRGSSEADYQGITTITFCVPGQPDVPATVNYFGCYLAIVEEDGTILRFFDPQGRMINELMTTRRTWDFVGLHSPTPIARIEIHPTESDENYAFDDMMFDPPVARSDAGDPNLVSIVMASGERLQAKAMQIEDEQLTLKELTVGLDEVKVPREEVAVLIPQFFGTTGEEPELGNRIRLNNGSLLRANLDAAGAKPLLFTEAALGVDQLQAVWHDSVEDIGKAFTFEPTSYPSLIQGESAVPLAGLQFGETGMTTEADTTDIEQALAYVSLQPIMIRAEAKADSSNGLIRTTDDQLLVLDQEFVRVEGWNQDGVSLKLGEAKAEVSWKEIRSLRFPQ